MVAITLHSDTIYFMSTPTEVFDASRHRAEISRLPDSFFREQMLELVEGPELTAALGNLRLHSDPTEIPPFIQTEIDYANRTDEDWAARIEQSRLSNDHATAGYLQQEAPRVKRALRVAENVLQDPRTQQFLEQGLTILPAEVIKDVQAGFFGEQVPAVDEASSESQRSELEIAGNGLILAVSRIAIESQNISARELLELTTAVGLSVSLRQELNDILPDPYQYKDASEYAGNIIHTSTGRWLKLISRLGDNWRFSETTTELDKELRSLLHVLQRTVHVLRLDREHDSTFEDALLETTHEAQLQYCQGFFMDLMNARWNIRGLPAVGRNIREATPLEEPTAEALTISSLFQTSSMLLQQSNIVMPSGLSEQSLRDSLEGNVMVRGDFRPEIQLRNALLQARKSSDTPDAVRECIRALQQLIHEHIT